MPEKCNEPCPELERLSSRLNELQAQNGDTHKEIFARMNKLERQEAVQEVQYSTILEKLDDLAGKVDALETKPGKRWEAIVDKVIWAVCAAVIAFLLARIGL